MNGLWKLIVLLMILSGISCSKSQRDSGNGFTIVARSYGIGMHPGLNMQLYFKGKNGKLERVWPFLIIGHGEEEVITTNGMAVFVAGVSDGHGANGRPRILSIRIPEKPVDISEQVLMAAATNLNASKQGLAKGYSFLEMNRAKDKIAFEFVKLPGSELEGPSSLQVTLGWDKIMELNRDVKKMGKERNYDGTSYFSSE